MIQETKVNKTIRIVARWFVGLVFIFSSFTKGVDPMGTAYKVEEYMTAWSIGGLSFDWALPLAPFLSMALITAEFLVGILLLTGAFRKLSAWLLLLMMVFFTFT
ncbi:MAG: DoxX family protein, partial [Bacteroidales bacterium]|nr:DoxX family protein [Bacteroidales bacterium]